LPNGLSRRAIRERLLQNRNTLPPDPFLQSCFWEKILENEVWEAVFHPEDRSLNDEDLGEALEEWGKKVYRTDSFYRTKAIWLSSVENIKKPEKGSK
jgi:hypothetical protein